MYRMSAADKYITLFGKTEMFNLRDYSINKKNPEPLPEKVRNYINGNNESKKSYEPVGGINYIHDPMNGGDVIWYQTLKQIPGPTEGGKKPSRRKTMKKRRKY
jgi:hypothetical protein